MPGFVKIHRKILKWEWWDDYATRNVFLYLLLKANYEDGEWKKIPVKRGQFITSREKIARECGLKVQPARRALNNLQNSQQITIKSTSKYSLIEINNYDLYQQNNQPLTRKPTTDQPANQPQYKKKEIKNKEKIIKEKFYDFVFLTETEHRTLNEKYGKTRTDEFITRLNNYIGSKGTKYKSHYHTILNWINKDQPVKTTNIRNLNDL